MIGLSLSNCILDILEEKVLETDVDKIIARTSCRHNGEWRILIGEYMRQQWKLDPRRAEEIVWQWIKEGKIEQPRLSPQPWVPDLRTGHWVNSESEIQRRPSTRD